jgi:two-component system OmpR family sensor kinase
MRRLTLRWKVTLTFAAVLLVVLAAAGAFLYLRLSVELRTTIDRSLQGRAGQVAGVVERSTTLPAAAQGTGLEPDENIAQVLRPDGTMVTASSHSAVALLDAAVLQIARDGPVFATRRGNRALDENLRLLARPVRGSDGEQYIVVVGASLDETAEALKSLLVQELLGLGGALLASSVGGYLVAGVALRPVEAMRRRAEEITSDADQQLPVPAVDDEIGRLGRTLNAMLLRLGQAQAAERRAIAQERQFVADASHELRTPLAIIKSEIEVALLDVTDAGRLAAALTSTAEETDRLTRLTDDLLLLARANEDQLPIRAAVIAVPELLERLAGGLRKRADLNGRRVITRVDSGLSVHADPLRLERALANLLDNAVRHGDGDIELIGQAQGGSVQIAVRDHGPGIADGFAGRAFERFSRADAGRSGPGTGLGLAIVRAVVTAPGGTVEARHADPGVLILITLPSGDPTDPAHAPRGNPLRAAAHEQG